MKTIGEIIKYKREKMGVNKSKLANKIGVSVTAISSWESGEYHPHVLVLCDLADIFGCTTDELLGRTECT